MDWKQQGGSAPATYQSYLVPAIFIPLAQRLMRFVAPGDELLDVACGTGAASRVAAEHGARVTGVDLGEGQLEIARSLGGDITYLQGDATALSFDDEAFDVVLCQQGLQFFPDKPAAVAEMGRVLRPGGRLVIATWAEPARTPFAPVLDAIGRHLGEEARRTCTAPFSLPAEDLRALVAGFGDVEFEEITFDAHFEGTAQDLARGFIGANPFVGTFEAAPEAVQRAVLDDVAAEVEEPVVRSMTSNVVSARR